tara:strand:+ start:320 stop:424 length:105 start_codon:yes stop_codon:yes gene_type:complete
MASKSVFIPHQVLRALLDYRGQKKAPVVGAMLDL